jgi:uncharacterized membrane protein YiaA
MAKKRKISKGRGLDAGVKRMDTCDIASIKWSVAAFVLFLITVWPALLELVLKVHWGWYLAIAIVLAIRPMKRYWGK